MKKLYMITIGGKAKNANIEVHDVQFIIAKNIEETYDVIKKNWYGIELKLHLDAFKEVFGADKHSINIVDNSTEDNNFLYFVNIGGYDETLMNEIHNYSLVVSNNVNTAKQKALSNFKNNLKEPHVDNIFRVDKSKLFNKLYKGNLTLKSNNQEYLLNPDWYGYKRLDI